MIHLLFLLPISTARTPSFRYSKTRFNFNSIFDSSFPQFPPIFSSFEETREHDQLNRSIKNEERRTIRLVPDDGFPKRKERDQVESIAVSKIQWQTGGLAALRMRSIVKLRIDSDLAMTPTFPPSFRHALLRSRARTIPSRSIHGICVRFRAIVHDSASNLFFFFFFD